MRTDPLKRPPVFGDIEQINALKSIRQEEEDNEGKTKFRIDISIDFNESFDIWAEDKEEASDIAREYIDIDSMDIDVNVKELFT